jgi:hypothetical protein
MRFEDSNILVCCGLLKVNGYRSKRVCHIVQALFHCPIFGSCFFIRKKNQELILSTAVLRCGHSVLRFMPDTYQLAPHREHFLSIFQVFEAVQLRILGYCISSLGVLTERIPSNGTQYSRIYQV